MVSRLVRSGFKSVLPSQAVRCAVDVFSQMLFVFACFFGRCLVESARSKNPQTCPNKPKTAKRASGRAPGSSRNTSGSRARYFFRDCGSARRLRLIQKLVSLLCFALAVGDGWMCDLRDLGRSELGRREHAGCKPKK